MAASHGIYPKTLDPKTAYSLDFLPGARSAKVDTGFAIRTRSTL